MDTDHGLAVLDVPVEPKGPRHGHRPASSRRAPGNYRGRHTRSAVRGRQHHGGRLYRSRGQAWEDLKSSFTLMLQYGGWHAILFTACFLSGTVEVITGLLTLVLGFKDALFLASMGVLVWTIGLVAFGIFIYKPPSPRPRRYR